MTIDVWLARLSHVAQIILVLGALFGYFYTVRPLHQKELLDEEIADKTMKLQTLQKEMEQARVQQESANRVMRELKQERESLGRDIALQQDRLKLTTGTLTRTQYLIFLETIEKLVAFDHLRRHANINEYELLERGDTQTLKSHSTSPYIALRDAAQRINEQALESPGTISAKQIEAFRPRFLKIIEDHKSALLGTSANIDEIVRLYNVEKNQVTGNSKDPGYLAMQLRIRKKYVDLLEGGFKKDLDRSFDFITSQKKGSGADLKK